jgi:hypothetical protein
MDGKEVQRSKSAETLLGTTGCHSLVGKVNAEDMQITSRSITVIEGPSRKTYKGRGCLNQAVTSPSDTQAQFRQIIRRKTGKIITQQQMCAAPLNW